MDLDSNEFYENVYEYAFEKARDVWLTAENLWSSTGIWFIVGASISENSLDESVLGSFPVWWGKKITIFCR